MRDRPEQKISAILAILAVSAAAAAAGVAGLFGGAPFSPQLVILLLAALFSLGAALAAIRANRLTINRRRSKRVFIVCAAEDLEHGRKVCAYIRSAGWEPWLPADHITPGQVWRATLVEAIRRSGAAVLVVSENFRLSRVANEELSIASRLLRGRRRAFSPIIPARIDYSVPPNALKRVRMADLRTGEGPEHLLRGIAEVLA